MREITLKLYLKDYDNPFTITVDHFQFEYGIGKEKWGENDLILQYAFKTLNLNCIKDFQSYLIQLSQILHDSNQIEEMQFIIVDKDNPDNIEYYSFKQGEFSNFNAQYVIDQNPRIMFAFNKVFQKDPE